jgi:SNF2 family DNA or RNA helicase
LITGTPIQNNLSEFHNVANFVCPGILGPLTQFRREYERPITAANNKKASSGEKAKGREMSRELDSITSSFMIRRLQKDILRVLLPPRIETLLFCRPSQTQCNLYQDFARDVAKNPMQTLPLLSKLRKLCSHPDLVSESDTRLNIGNSHDNLEDSGKLNILDNLLVSVRETCPGDKVIVVSNFTSALTIIEKSILQKRNWTYLRLDGSVSQNDRQNMVDAFNRCSADHSFVFLLSSKAGGCGLNLIGANRLVMFDPDFNPATDAQAMARIYRQGQRKSCYIYRLFTSGTVEEGEAHS